MKAFMKGRGLERLSLEARLVYTGFSVFMIVGLASSVWIYSDDDLGASAESAARYYLGEQSPRPGEQAPSEYASLTLPSRPSPDGPMLDLPTERFAPVEEAPLRLAKPARQVMETFHFHLFSAPICLMIIAHIFMMCGLSTWLKSTVIGLGFTSTLLHIAAPPMIRFAWPELAVLVFPSALVMGVSWLLMTTWPVFEMWTLSRREALRRIDEPQVVD